MALKELSDGGPDGTRLGQSATDKIAFHGTAVVAQQTVTAVATGATAATIVTALQALQDAINTLGLIKNA
jgi:hypothetical protein